MSLPRTFDRITIGVRFRRAAIYIHQMMMTFSQPGYESSSELIEAHSTILDGQAYYFIGLRREASGG